MLYFLLHMRHLLKIYFQICNRLFFFAQGLVKTRYFLLVLCNDFLELIYLHRVLLGGAAECILIVVLDSGVLLLQGFDICLQILYLCSSIAQLSLKFVDTGFVFVHLDLILLILDS